MITRRIITIHRSPKLFTYRSLSTNSSEISQETRVRFAPSPTGSIHLGGLRAAFYNYLFAKQRDGRFIVRIEDTDQARNVPGSAEEIEDVLCWAGLKPDESPKLGGSYGPYVQSQRLHLYIDRAHELIDQGKAYKCFCSSTRLYLLRKSQSRMRIAPHYDRRCLNLTTNEIKQQMEENNGRYAIRFILPDGETSFDDVIFGPINVDLVAKKESDPIILKSDGYPTYHFANVVDDASMKITNVIRGAEWWQSTAKHINIYQAFGWKPPQFIHFPLLKMEDGSKMSKRNKHSHVGEFIEAGYRPTALFNFITQAGGGVPTDKQDLMQFWTFEDFVKGFDFTKLKKNPARLDYNRLDVYNSKELQKVWADDPESLVKELCELLQSHGIKPDVTEEEVKTILDNLVREITTIKDLLAPDYLFIWNRPVPTWSKQDYKDKGWRLEAILEDTIKTVELSECDDKVKFNGALKELSKRHNIDHPAYMKFLRLTLTNREVGLPIFEIAQCLGPSRLGEYLKLGLSYVKS